MRQFFVIIKVNSLKPQQHAHSKTHKNINWTIDLSEDAILKRTEANDLRAEELIQIAYSVLLMKLNNDFFKNSPWFLKRACFLYFKANDLHYFH